MQYFLVVNDLHLCTNLWSSLPSAFSPLSRCLYTISLLFISLSPLHSNPSFTSEFPSFYLYHWPPAISSLHLTDFNSHHLLSPPCSCPVCPLFFSFFLAIALLVAFYFLCFPSWLTDRFAQNCEGFFIYNQHVYAPRSTYCWRNHNSVSVNLLPYIFPELRVFKTADSMRLSTLNQMFCYWFIQDPLRNKNTSVVLRTLVSC